MLEVTLEIATLLAILLSVAALARPTVAELVEFTAMLKTAELDVEPNETIELIAVLELVDIATDIELLTLLGATWFTVWLTVELLAEETKLVDIEDTVAVELAEITVPDVDDTEDDKAVGVTTADEVVATVVEA